jgi:NAD(P)-dependent dehydrogenase (short-subunit alcohol dehydrogenase family)
VNAIAPGFIDTDMTAPLGPLRRFFELQTPMGRFGEPDDIAWAAVYLRERRGAVRHRAGAVAQRRLAYESSEPHSIGTSK